MDVLPLGKKCILIPTPGQAEQEYLAAWLAHKNYSCIGFQHNLSLPDLIEKIEKLTVPDLSSLKSSEKIEAVIATLLTRLNTKQ
jgi:UDP-N-acetylglucosamine:LPS N-acetylglucosamine transferase